MKVTALPRGPITETREEHFTRLYLDHFPEVARYIARKGGNLMDARDTFQEALVIYYEKVMVKKEAPKTNSGAYLFGITRHLWSKRCREKQRFISLSIQDRPEVPEKHVTNRLLHILEKSGEKCMELLQSFYYENLSMKNMADRFGFVSERSATVQKFKCLEKIRNEVKTHALNYEDFLD